MSHQWRVGDALKCFTGREDQYLDPGLFNAWKPAHIVELDEKRHRMLVKYDKGVDFPEEWLQIPSKRILLPNQSINDLQKQANSKHSDQQHQVNDLRPNATKIRSASVSHPAPSDSSHTARTHQLVLDYTEQHLRGDSHSSDRHSDPSSNISSVHSSPAAASIQNSTEDEMAQITESMKRIDMKTDQLIASHDQPYYHAVVSPRSAQAAEQIAAQGIDASFFAHSTASSANSSTTKPSQPANNAPYRSPPPPLPVTHPPHIPTKRADSRPTSPAVSPRANVPPLPKAYSSPSTQSSSTQSSQSNARPSGSADIEFRRALQVGSVVDAYNPVQNTWSANEIMQINRSSDDTNLVLQSLADATKVSLNIRSNRIAPPFTKSVEPAPHPPGAVAARQMQPPTNPPSLPKQNTPSTNPSTNVSTPSAQSPSVLSPRSSSSQTFNPTHTQPMSFPSSSPPPVPPQYAQSSQQERMVPQSPHPPSNLPTPPPGFGASLNVGDQLDCLDTDKIWRLAQVINASANDVFVHYEHWQSKWNEWIKRDSRRLQPARSITNGYTGPPRNNNASMPVAQPIQPNGQVPAQAKPVPWTCPPYRPSPVYDCKGECKWKRVLSMGLGHREIQAVDALFTRCCQLQDNYQTLLMSEQQLPHALEVVQTRLKEARAEIETQANLLPAFAEFFMKQCRAILTTVSAGIDDMHEAQKRQELALQEDLYMQRLAGQFDLVRVTADGNCLFAATAQGHARVLHELANQKLADQSDEKPSLPQTEESPAPSSDSSVSPSSPASPAPVVITETAPCFVSSTASPHQAAQVYRERVIEKLMEDISFHSQIQTELQQAIVQERQGSGDPTSKALVRELHDQCGDNEETIRQAISSESGVFVYTGVMGKDGIYGTALEVEALSKLTRCPIHIYFRSGSHDDQDPSDGEVSSEIKPTQIVGAEFNAPPICLAYYMGNRHYNLLVRKPPPPPEPVVPPAAPQADEQSADHGSAAGDDELMYALLANEESPMPPDQKNPVMLRAASTGQLPSLSTPKSASSPSHSKDELTLLSPQSHPPVSYTSNKSAASKPQSVSHSPDATLRPPADHPTSHQPMHQPVYQEIRQPIIPPIVRSQPSPLNVQIPSDSYSSSVNSGVKPPWTALIPISLQAAVPVASLISPTPPPPAITDSPSPVLVSRTLSDRQSDHSTTPPQVSISQQPVLNEQHFIDDNVDKSPSPSAPAESSQ